MSCVPFSLPGAIRHDTKKKYREKKIFRCVFLWYEYCAAAAAATAGNTTSTLLLLLLAADGPGIKSNI